MHRLVLALLIVASLASACDAPAPPARTAVPTWTLPFIPPTLTPALAPATPVPDNGPSPTNTRVIRSPTPTDTIFTPTPSPTARPGIDPTLGASTPDPFATHVTPIPEPMPQLHLDEDIINILLLGRDTAKDARNYRTDVMIIASINKEANAVTLLTLPRDLFVYVPGWTMNRLNTAAGHGDAIGYPGGGVALLEQTILYNLGIPIHGWARIDFDGFKEVVDILGGVDLPVTCEMADWRLRDPALDPQNADNWHIYTVTPGVQHMDGDFALWYARSRKQSSDFDRSRRQHQLLRGIFDKALQLDVLPKLPDLYGQYIKIVDTDMGLGDILQFVPMATRVESARIKSRFVGRDQVFSWVTPQGAQVLLPDRDAISRVLAEAFLPPSENVLVREAPAVEIWNGTPNKNWETLAADNLAWAGIQPVIGQADATNYGTTLIYDFTTSPKASARPELQRIFHVSDANVIAAPDPNAPYPFRVVLGSDYISCVRPVSVARGTPTPVALTPAPPVDNIVHAAGIFGPPPKVDGDLSEWTFLVYPIDQPAFGRESWLGPADLSAVWNIAWDDKYIYLALKVQDDVFVQAARGDQLFNGDSLEVWLNIDPGSRTHELTGRDFQLGISPGDFASPFSTVEAYLWHPKEEARPIGDVVIVAKKVEGGYHMEVAVPWTIVRVVPFAEEGFAFTLALNDDDTAGGANQETQLVSIKESRLADPMTWGLLVLDQPPGP